MKSETMVVMIVALLASGNATFAQNAGDPASRPRAETRQQPAPSTTLSPDGVRNGTNKADRDQHSGGENPDRTDSTTLPAPSSK